MRGPKILLMPIPAGGSGVFVVKLFARAESPCAGQLFVYHSIFSFAPVNCAMPTDADRIADYKGITIRTFKTANGSWRAIITKVDGSKIKAASQNELFDLISVQLDSPDRYKALKEAKRLIDAGGMT